MKCPVCNATLQVAEREKVEVDYCPQCRGVWLDRGELDKIIERSSREGSAEDGKRIAKTTRSVHMAGERKARSCANCSTSTKSLSENLRGLAHFAESSEQNVPVPLS